MATSRGACAAEGIHTPVPASNIATASITGIAVRRSAGASTHMGDVTGHV